MLVLGDSLKSCMASSDVVTSTLCLPGFQVAWQKVTSPSTLTTFLGINIDSVGMELSLPMEKVDKLRDLTITILNRGHSTKNELECLDGLVSYCSYVVRGGRTFSRRIFDLSASHTRQSRAIPLDDAIKEDAGALNFFGVLNGKVCIVRDVHPFPMCSDASFEGFGAWFYDLWSSDAVLPVPAGCGHIEPLPAFTLSRTTNMYELWPLVVGLQWWAPTVPTPSWHSGMCFVWNISASYIRSVDNTLANPLSCLPYSGVPLKCLNILQDTNMLFAFSQN